MDDGLLSSFQGRFSSEALFPRLSPPGDRWWDVLGFVLQNNKCQTSEIWPSHAEPMTTDHLKINTVHVYMAVSLLTNWKQHSTCIHAGFTIDKLKTTQYMYTCRFHYPHTVKTRLVQQWLTGLCAAEQLQWLCRSEADNSARCLHRCSPLCSGARLGGFFSML